jgi:flavin reductase (DIM6/NTAB) family NADH-FMN oxidoreductase RutF
MINNTLVQATDTPLRLAVTLNKNGLTHDIIAASGQFSASVLSQSVNFALFQHLRGRQTTAREWQRKGSRKQQRMEQIPFPIPNRQLPAPASNFQFRDCTLELASPQSLLSS